LAFGLVLRTRLPASREVRALVEVMTNLLTMPTHNRNSDLGRVKVTLPLRLGPGRAIASESVTSRICILTTPTLRISRN
jgi:hypothetical protein